MFYGLKGTVTHIDKDFIGLDCNDVIYRIFVSLVTKKELLEESKKIFLYTYTNVKENSVEIFGFKTTEELFCFKLLLSVSGVGTRICMSILSGISVFEIISAVASNDAGVFQKIGGVGSKLACRIVLELKDKIKNFNGGITKEQKNNAPRCDFLASSTATEAIDALFSLGYSRERATSIVSSFDSSLPVEELIRLSLRFIANKRF
ncbi:MAG: Holliday junction branch migration protein RuvA [Oscillospiraceae bacterium]|jgi:Holliday junction DNA helicase RuvA|nr:Holliday junction branch migration protein RuvA [Oscillospiraceae bacterium]